MDAAELYVSFRDNIDLFAEYFCDSVIPSKDLDGNDLKERIPKFHKEIYELIFKNRLVLAAPRGFAKSTISSKIYPLHQALFKQKKDICIISASESLATEHLRWIKQEVESNPKINEFWGDLRSGKWTENHIILKHADGTLVNLRAKGAGAQIRGFRPDCIILDDIETDDSVLSEDQRKKLKDWLFKACINTLVVDGQLLIIGTVIHPLAVLADLLAVPNGWEKRKFQAYNEAIEREGYELWPELWTHQRLQDRKAEIGSTAFASEYLNNPLADENAFVREEMIRYWEEIPKQYSGVLAIDPAYTEDPNNDYKVCSYVIMDQDHNRYLIDYIRNHAPTGAFIDQVLNLFLRHRSHITGVGIPSTGGDSEFWNSFQQACDRRNIHPPLIQLKNAFTTTNGKKITNKHRRIGAALQPLFEKGKYYIHANHLEARDELLTIGNSRWDDLVDSMAYAEQILTPTFFETGSYDFDNSPVYAQSAEGYGIEY